MRETQLTVVSKIWDALCASKARVHLVYGGTGSGKSVAVAQFLVRKLYSEENIRILVVRKTLVSLKESCYRLLVNLLTQCGLSFETSLSPLRIWNGSNEIIFRGLDNPKKIKSIEKINYVWVEEASNESTAEDFLMLNLYCRGENQNGPNQLFFTFNPINLHSYLKPFTEVPPEGVMICHSTYTDNEFLEPDSVRVIEELIQDDEYDKIYRRGLWAQPTEIVYSNWDVVNAMPLEYEKHVYGLDFGFSLSETALVELRRVGREVWARQLIYETHLTVADTIERFKVLGIDKEIMIVADKSRPESIEQIERAGYRIRRQESLPKEGIDRVKQFKVHLLSDSPDYIKERQMYKWRKDHLGNVLEEPVKFRDHLMDAEKYGFEELAEESAIFLIHDGSEQKQQPTEEEIAAACFDRESAWQSH